MVFSESIFFFNIDFDKYPNHKLIILDRHAFEYLSHTIDSAVISIFYYCMHIKYLSTNLMNRTYKS